jgi:hypothetical protein
MEQPLVPPELADGEKTPPLSNRRDYGSLLASSNERENGSHKNGSSPPKRGVRWPRGTPTSTSTGLAASLASPPRSERSLREHRLNQWLEGTIFALVLFIAVSTATSYWYFGIRPHHVRKQQYAAAIQAHAAAAEERREACQDIDWWTACDRLTAGARRRLAHAASSHYSSSNAQPQHHRAKGRMSHGHGRNRHHPQRSKNAALTKRPFVRNASLPVYVQEQALLESDDPAVTYDNNCLKVYRLDINHGQITFPYHSSQLLRLGGNQTMALIIQHGALRDSESYFCSFKKLLFTQQYRDVDDILVIAPDFNYATDDLVHPMDAVWNSSKPWGDWRVGAESDPRGVRDPDVPPSWWATRPPLRPTISSFDVLDTILALITDKKLYPQIDKISFVGHSAGTFLCYIRRCCLFTMSHQRFITNSCVLSFSYVVRWSNDSTVRDTQCLGGALVHGHGTGQH